VFWVISVYFNLRNTLPKFGTFLLGHPVCDEYHAILKGTFKAGPCSKNRELDIFHVSKAVMVIISAHLLGKEVTVHTKQNGRPGFLL